jgi:alkylation response protein AidB-like acyl-CoA dehydrogenase
MAEEVCSAAIDVFAGARYMQDFGVEQIYCDARVCKIYVGTNDIQRIVIGRNL